MQSFASSDIPPPPLFISLFLILYLCDNRFLSFISSRCESSDLSHIYIIIAFQGLQTVLHSSVLASVLTPILSMNLTWVWLPLLFHRKLVCCLSTWNFIQMTMSLKNIFIIFSWILVFFFFTIIIFLAKAYSVPGRKLSTKVLNEKFNWTIFPAYL